MTHHLLLIHIHTLYYYYSLISFNISHLINYSLTPMYSHLLLSILSITLINYMNTLYLLLSPIYLLLTSILLYLPPSIYLLLTQPHPIIYLLYLLHLLSLNHFLFHFTFHFSHHHHHPIISLNILFPIPYTLIHVSLYLLAIMSLNLLHYNYLITTLYHLLIIYLFYSLSLILLNLHPYNIYIFY